MAQKELKINASDSEAKSVFISKISAIRVPIPPSCASMKSKAYAIPPSSKTSKPLMHPRISEHPATYRPMVIIYAEGNYKVKVASSHFDFNPREEPLAHNCPMIIN